MRNYKVVISGTNYAVKESATNLTVASYSDHKTANEAARRLERGSGFNGITPQFFASNTNYEVAEQVRAIKSGVDF